MNIILKVVPISLFGLILSISSLYSESVTVGSLIFDVESDSAYVIGTTEGISGDIIIPSSVQGRDVLGIHSNAFASRNSITSILIPEGVTSIGQWAFMDCTGLLSISIPESVNEILEFAFIRCASLETISLPSNLTVISDYLFQDCTLLTNVSIPNGIISIGENAFRNCTSLQNVQIPSSVENIGAGAFYNCDSIEEIVIPSGVTVINTNSFGYCDNLSYITLPSTLLRIEDSAFSNSGPFLPLVIPQNVIYLGSYSLYNTSGLNYIYFEGDNFLDSNDNYYINTNFNTILPNWADVFIYEGTEGWESLIGSTGYQSTRTSSTKKTLNVIMPPTVNLASDYEILEGTSITINAEPSTGYPADFTYQWYVNGFAIPPNFGGEASTFTINSDSSNAGNWQVIVTNSTGTNENNFTVTIVRDSDYDGIYDYKETNTGIYISENDTGTNPFSNDTDGDGFTDDAELDIHNTDPNKADTDGDGLSDKVEVDDLSSNPNSVDSDADGFPDNVEYYLSGFDINSDSSSLSYSGAGLIEQSAYDTVVAERDAALAAQASAEAERDSRPTQASYDAVVAERDAKLTLDEVKDLRAGSTMIEIHNGQATLTMEVEESDDLGIWTNGGASTLQIPINAEAGKKFFRFKMAE